MKNLLLFYAFCFSVITTLTLGQAPTIENFHPAEGVAGTEVSITGTNFNALADDNIVFFGAVRAIVNSASATHLLVEVPIGATYQPITVTVNGLTAYSALPFNLTFPFEGTIGGSFENRIDFPAGYQAKWGTVGDIDGDGKNDIVVVDQNSDVVSILRNVSTPGDITWNSFEPKQDFPTGPGPYAVAVGDVDSDGKPDLVVTNANSASISILRNTSTPGAIAFSHHVVIDALFGPLSVAIGDLDLDGKPDVAVTNGNTLSIFSNTGQAGTLDINSFSPPVDFHAGNGGIWSVVLQDVDGDGKRDITVASGGDNVVSIFRNISTTGSLTHDSFEAKVDFAVGSYPSIVSLADFDGDLKPDMMVGNAAGNTISLFRNIAVAGAIDAGSFETRLDLASNGGPWNPTAGDVDGDGKQDIIVRDGAMGKILILKNRASVGVLSANSFSPPYIVQSDGLPLGISVADMDGDGKSDLILSNEGLNVISVFRNLNFFDPSGPTYLQLTNVTGTSLTGSFVASPDMPDGYIVTRRINAFANAPSDGTTYTTGQTIGEDVIAYVGSATTFEDTGLSPGYEYFYNCYAYYDTGSEIDYITAKRSAGIAFTIGIDLGPIVTVSPPEFSLDDQITLVFDATKSFPVNDLVGASSIYMYSGIISESPESGNWNLNHTNYIDLIPLGDNKWSLTFIPRNFYNVPFEITAYRIAMVFFDGESGRGVSYDGKDVYLTVLPSSGPPAPEALQAGFVSSSGFEAEWQAVAGIYEYHMDVSTDEFFQSFQEGYEDKLIYAYDMGVMRNTVGGLSPNTTYFYRVRAGRYPMLSENSSTISVSTLQNPTTASRNVWVKPHGGAGTDEIQTMTSDSEGNVYAAGHFSGTITIGSATLVSKGEFDIFYVRYDRQGNVIWARSIGGAALDNEVSLATDSKGLYMTAQFAGDIDVDPGAGVKLFSNRGQAWINDGFFARFSLADGSLVWAHQLEDASTWSSSAIGVDRSGVYLAGYFYGTVDFDPGEGVTNLWSYGRDIFVAKYLLDGSFQWAKSMGGYGDDAAYGLLVDNTGVYIHGSYGWDTDFDPSSNDEFLYGFGGFFGRYDLSGNFVYIKNVGSGTIFSLAKFGSSLFISGDFFGTIDADPGDGYELIGSDYLNSGLVGKYDLLDGSYKWANSLVTTAFIGPRKIVADGSGVYVNGYFAGSVDFDPGIGEANRTSARIDAFACGYSWQDGRLEWAKGIGSTGWAVSIAATLTRHGYYIGGLFAETVNFDPYENQVLRTSYTAEPDIFIARYQLSRSSQTPLRAEDGVRGAEEQGVVSLFPNPTGETLQIEWHGLDAGAPLEIVIVDQSGAPVQKHAGQIAGRLLDVAALPSGHYILRAKQFGHIRSAKFFKK